MACDLATGTYLSFLKSGVQIRPYEVRSTAEQYRFSHVSAVVSRAAGRLVANSVRSSEPVHLYIQGEVQGRYLVDRNAIQTTNEDATITLYDPWKVLYGGSVNKTYQDETLGDVISEIINRADDPNNVISGVANPSSLSSSPVRGSFGDVLPNNAQQIIETLLEAHTGFDIPDTSLSFNRVSPAEAIFEIEERFGLQTWVDVNGMFYYTMPATKQYAQLGLIPGSRQLRINEWNVTLGSGHVSSVIARGPLRYIQQSTFDGRFVKTTPNNIYVEGRADLSGVPGSQLVIETPTASTTPEAAANAARRRLILEYMDRRAGNIVFNGLASRQTSALIALSPGDYIESAAGTVGNCNRQIDAGSFFVRSVHHTISARDGWLVTVEVAAIPSNTITTASFIYNPETSITWDNLADYQESDAPIKTPFWDIDRILNEYF